MNHVAALLIKYGVKFEYTCSNGIEQITAPEHKIEVSTQGDKLYYNYRSIYSTHKKGYEAFTTIINQIETIIK